MMLFALELPFFHCGIYSYSKFEALITRIGVVVTNQVLSRSGTNSRCGKICLNTLISTRSAWLRPVKLFSPKKTNLEQHACESAHKQCTNNSPSTTMRAFLDFNVKFTR
jgi:hypothetical protein